MQNRSEIVGHGQSQDPGHNDPTEESTYKPIGFPRPNLHSAIWHIEAARRETAEPVEQNTDGGIRIHLRIAIAA